MDCRTCRDNKREPVPFIAHEMAMARAERTVKRMVAVVIVMSVLLAGTIAGFLWYLSQYDFSGEEIIVDACDGHANYIGQDGDINNGTYYGAEESTHAEESLPVKGNGSTQG